MATVGTYPIRCPQCGAVQNVDLVEAFDVALEPELRVELLQNRMNQVSCVGCSMAFRVDKPLLYRDSTRNALILWMPAAEAEAHRHPETLENAFQRLAEVVPDDADTPDLHMVLDRVELVERIFLLEADLDERIIEYVKYLVYAQNREQVNPETKRLLFNAQDSTDEKLVFVVQDLASKKLEALVEYGREAYNALVEMFDRDSQTPNLLELFPGPHISARALFL